MPFTARRGGFKRGGAAAASKYSRKRADPDEYEDEEDRPARVTKKAKKAAASDEDEEVDLLRPKMLKDADGNGYIPLNPKGTRRIAVSEFKSRALINIREFYQNDDEKWLPGKKGISLTPEQWSAVLAAAPLIEKALLEKGAQTVARPKYEDYDNVEDEDDGQGAEAAEEEAEQDIKGEQDDENENEDEDEGPVIKRE